jgi:hypothetical protein
MANGHSWTALDFTNARDGVALTLNDAPSPGLWNTSDGGLTGRRVTI